MAVGFELAGAPFLSIAILAPLVGALVILAAKLEGRALRGTALAFTIPSFLIGLQLLLDYGLSANPGIGYEERYAWIPSLGSSIHLGVDGLSAPLIFLTTLIFPLAFIFSWDHEHRAREYFALFLVLEAAIVGVFAALDYLLFYVFWEVTLIPMFFIIYIWGGDNKRYASFKFLIYTFLASLVLLVGLLAIYFAANTAGARTFDVLDLQAQGAAGALGRGVQVAAFGALFVGFATKMPIVPFHTWLPDAHVQAPTAGSVVLAAVLLKMGSYGLIRIALPTLPEGTHAWAWPMAILGIISMLYGAFVALGQRDLKSMIAYSSISHMGAVLLGIATLTTVGLTGATYMMLAHGFISAMLFMSAGVVQHHTGTRLIDKLGGLAGGSLMPIASALTLFAFMASLGLPFLAGFVAELPIFIATWQTFGWLVVPALLTLLVTAGYYLYAFQRAYCGPPRPEVHVHGDVTWYEFWPMLILAIVTLIFGLVPNITAEGIAQASAAILVPLGVA